MQGDPETGDPKENFKGNILDRRIENKLMNEIKLKKRYNFNCLCRKIEKKCK
jgi:hypothetical protein